jgi:hypothetical protein
MKEVKDLGPGPPGVERPNGARAAKAVEARPPARAAASEKKPAAQLPDSPNDVAHDEHEHDVYFMGKDNVVYKFPVNYDGSYTKKPTTPAYSSPNLRHIYNRANPNLTEEGERRPRGPVFATLPLTAEPGPASISTCYVINPNNLIYRNAYTAEEWFSAGAIETRAPTIPENFDLLVAGPKGRIYLMQVTEDGDACTCRKLEVDDLKNETDLWDQLRNGTVLGRVLFENRIVPMVNVTSVQHEGGES